VQWSFARKHRNAFPLESPVTQERIYLDYAATAPLRPEAREAMLPHLGSSPSNPSSLHREGRIARAALEDARARVAAVLGAKRREIIFTASGSEADALALRGIAAFHSGGHLVSCAIEHHAVLRNIDALVARGYASTLLPVTPEGLVDPERFEASLRPQTFLTSIAYANNEIGTIEPIAHLASIARRHRVLFHTDAVQAPGWLPLDVGALGVDALALSPHKFGGPHGTGILFLREGTAAAPLVEGGGQEAGLRSGTEDVAAAVGAAAALEAAEAERAVAVERTGRLRDALEARILRSISGSHVNGMGAARLPSISSLSFDGVMAEALAARLDIEGISASPGSACTSGLAQASHVIAALGTGDARSALRLSLGSMTTEHEIEHVAALLPMVVSALREGE
jgi:cysteine desulfurase